MRIQKTCFNPNYTGYRSKSLVLHHAKNTHKKVSILTTLDIGLKFITAGTTLLLFAVSILTTLDIGLKSFPEKPELIARVFQS